MSFQVADVAKPMASAVRITACGHRLVIDDDEDTHVQNENTGRAVKLHKTGHVLVMKVHVVPARTKSDGRSHQMDVDMLRELDFTRQED